MDNSNEKNLQPAGIFQPLGAVIIDLLIILIPLYILFEISFILGLEVIFTFVFFVLLFIIIPVYFTYFLSRYGQTPGYKFLNIKMVTKGGENPSGWKAFLKVFSVMATNNDMNYGYSSMTDNLLDITTIKTGESKWKTIFTCGCLAPLLFVFIIYAFMTAAAKFDERRPSGAYENLTK